MTALEKLAETLFPDVKHTPDEYEALYPPRPLKDCLLYTSRCV